MDDEIKRLARELLALLNVTDGTASSSPGVLLQATLTELQALAEPSDVIGASSSSTQFCAPFAYVISANLYRRHLEVGQRAVIAARMAKLKKGGDRKTDEFKVQSSKDQLIL